MGHKIETVVATAVAPIVQAHGMELVDVTYRTKDQVCNITIYIDKEGGVTIEDCETIHHAIDQPLDDLDPTCGAPYVLNVSSSGLDRPFSKQRDFERNINKEIEISFYAAWNGEKRIVAQLLGYDEKTIQVLFQDKKVDIKRDRISKITLAVQFD